MDIVDKFDHLRITGDGDYKYWNIFLFGDQRYLGRCYAWIKNEEEMLDFSQLTWNEWVELRRLLKDWKEVVDTLWKPDKLNYDWLGNYLTEHNGHGHMHLIPRYMDTREVHDHTFVDERWGKNWSPYNEDKLSSEKLQAIKESVRKELHRLLYS